MLKALALCVHGQKEPPELTSNEHLLKNMKVENKKTNPAQFVRQVRQELSKVTWPDKRDTFISSAIVIVLIILFSIFFLLTDQLWSFLIKNIIQIGVNWR